MRINSHLQSSGRFINGPKSFKSPVSRWLAQPERSVDPFRPDRPGKTRSFDAQLFADFVEFCSDASMIAEIFFADFGELLQ